MELIPVSWQSAAGDISHKAGAKLLLLSTRPMVTFPAKEPKTPLKTSNALRYAMPLGNQLPRSTQPGHPPVGRHNKYQNNGGDALWLGSKGRYGLCVGGR